MARGSHAGAWHPIPESSKKYKGTERKWEEFYVKAAKKKKMGQIKVLESKNSQGKLIFNISCYGKKKIKSNGKKIK